jgi:uncharacterized peroxidase-related enzyme
VLEGDDGMRIATKALDRYPWYLRPLFWHQRRKFGAVLDAALLWARSPKLFMGLAFLYGMIDRHSSPLDPALRSLVIVRVSQINHCRFCVDLNSAILLKRGVDMDKLKALSDWRGSNLFDERERAALGYADGVTHTDTQVDSAQFECLRDHFSEDAIIELTALIAFQNMSSKFNAALDVAPQGFCRIQDAASKPPTGEIRA